MSEELPSDTPQFAPPRANLPLAGLQFAANAVDLSIPNKRYLLILRANQADEKFQNWFKTYFETNCPHILDTVRHADFTVYWQSPDQLLLAFDHVGTYAAWHEKLHNQATNEMHLSLVDVSDYYAFIRMNGKRAFDVLRQGCPYDFRKLQPSQAVSSHYEKANMMIDFVAQDTVEVMVRASFADYVWQHLVYASKQLHGFST